ncbi:MAG: FAD-binding oxidoreductase [Deltaproteobacteria bacterium]|jgi:FAD/FMN-containing dehydrogenase|nr:FAD-binding oxidoreductase [Deltaproteobacteria bacterium]MBT4641975.1 FAD-binding oxidoreductase [Deltaproteobacteria bacterium]MBT6498854.1 FAD-binding oxidoreductase [Deltaproteobacteria bacterium]MBT6612000.1 FAD-binding oxidoreductase [Deltaproteobacteria bacterium]MBT7713579.1 FAD-binding oxidoreductase [Deltaproteobacteria bacterium]
MNTVYNALADIVGEDYASAQIEELVTYSKDLGTSKPKLPDYVVVPANTEELQQIIRFANREKVPIVPLGGGMSLAGIAQPLRGGILIDMKRMDRIIEVNEKSRYTVVEAGTSHGKLSAYLKKHHPDLMHSMPDAPPAATVGGNIAIHGQGDLAHPHGFNSDMINGLEVILPTGEICKFGSCSVGSGWFTQHPLPDMSFFLGWGGATGIITKVSLRLFPCKKIREMDMFLVEDPELIPDVLYDLTHVGMAEDLAAFSGAIPPFSNKLHHISIFVSGDSEDEIEFKRRLMYDERLAKYIENGTGGIVATAQDIERPKTSKSADWKKGGGFEYVGSIMPVTAYAECYRRGVEISERHDIPYTVVGRVIGSSHAMMFAWSYAFNRADPATVQHAKEALHETDDLVLGLGGTIWKPAVYGQQIVMEHMEPNTLQLMNNLKNMLDPNGIMNPGNWEVA